jgi:hypothetical protein
MRFRRFPDFADRPASWTARPGRVILEVGADQAPLAVSTLRESWMCAARADERVMREAPELVTPELLLAVSGGTLALLQVDSWLDPLARLVCGLPVPGRSRFALWRLHRRVGLVLDGAGVSARLLSWSVSGGCVLTVPGRALRTAARAFAVGELALIGPKLLGDGGAAAALSEWAGLLLVTLAASAGVGVWLWARVTGRSTGPLVSWPNGTDSGMSARERDQRAEAARRELLAQYALQHGSTGL